MGLLRLIAKKKNDDWWQGEHFCGGTNEVLDGITIRPYLTLKPGDYVSVAICVKRKEEHERG